VYYVNAHRTDFARKALREGALREFRRRERREALSAADRGRRARKDHRASAAFNHA
jgi:hypothetical protein